MTLPSLAPFTSRLAQRLPGSRPLDSYAVESVVICGAEEQPMRAAVYPDGELDRVTGVHEFSGGLADELHLATRELVQHTETIARRMRDVIVTDGLLCNHRAYRRLTFGRPTAGPVAIQQVDETVAFCSTDAGNDYFAHFLLDDATTALLGAEFGQVVFGGVSAGRTAHCRDYMSRFNIQYTESASARFRDLWWFTDHPQNSHRRARLEQLRARLRAHYAPAPTVAPVYLQRGSSGSPRVLDNEAEIETLLSARGFAIIDPETLTADELCRHINGARLVVGIEGSQLAHGLLNLHPGGGLLCIQPAARFNAVFRSFCNSAGLDWGFVVAEGTAERFSVSADRLLAVADRLLEQSALPC